LEIERPEGEPLLIPFTQAAVPLVDLEAGRVVVAPPEEIEAR
jgi:16S rRNA processing protein RimM